MKTSPRLYLSLLALALCFSFGITGLMAQEMQHGETPQGLSLGDVSTWFGILELPVLSVCIFFAFRTASALKGGMFGQGMAYIAWGFLVMAVGHLHMQVEHYFQLNLFNATLGRTLGALFWFVALIITWALSGLGFYNIYKASKGR